eukprot:366301-Chlamydomonas_euryale.AAC.13
MQALANGKAGHPPTAHPHKQLCHSVPDLAALASGSSLPTPHTPHPTSLTLPPFVHCHAPAPPGPPSPGPPSLHLTSLTAQVPPPYTSHPLAPRPASPCTRTPAPPGPASTLRAACSPGRAATRSAPGAAPTMRA